MKGKRAAGLRARPSLFAVLLGTLLAAGCRDTTSHRTPTDTRVTDPSPTRPALADVIARRAGELMAIPGVAGVAEAALPDGSPCLRIYVVARTSELERRLPRTIDGWPVDIEESGPFRALGDTATEAPSSP